MQSKRAEKPVGSEACMAMLGRRLVISGYRLTKAIFVTAALLFAAGPHARAQPHATTQAEAPTRDTSFIGPDGTAYITRVIPVPATVSPEAQRQIARRLPDNPAPFDLAAARGRFDVIRKRNGALALERYPAHVSAGVMAGVPVTIVTPVVRSAPSPFILIDVHGGALRLDCCSLAESIPIASLMNAEVVAVGYRLAPEHPFPAAVDDVVAVYRDVLKTHAPGTVVIYGTSAGATITGEVAVRLKAAGIPQPAALGVFSGFGDFSRPGDSMSFFSDTGVAGYMTVPIALAENRRAYAGTTRLDDPLLSPTKGDLSGLPPTLFITSTRDWFLSGTSLFHRAMLRAGNEAALVVFEGLGHAFWVNPALPESDEAYRIAVKFFRAHLK